MSLQCNGLNLISQGWPHLVARLCLYDQLGFQVLRTFSRFLTKNDLLISVLFCVVSMPQWLKRYSINLILKLNFVSGVQSRVAISPKKLIFKESILIGFFRNMQALTVFTQYFLDIFNLVAGNCCGCTYGSRLIASNLIIFTTTYKLQYFGNYMRYHGSKIYFENPY